MGADDSSRQTLRERTTHPEPPGHAEDHLRVIVRREQLLSEGKRRWRGKRTKFDRKMLSQQTGRVQGCCVLTAQWDRLSTTAVVNWPELAAVRRQEVTRRDVTGGDYKVRSGYITPTWGRCYYSNKKLYSHRLEWTQKQHSEVMVIPSVMQGQNMYTSL